MNRSLTVSDAPRARALAWPSARDWAFAFVVLTIWTSVAPVAYIFRVGTFGIAPYEIFEVCALACCLVLWWRTPESFVFPTGAGWLIAFMALTSVSALQADTGRTVVTVLGRFWLGWMVVFLLPSVVTDRRRLTLLVAAMLLQAAALIFLTLGAALSAFGLPALRPVLMIQFQKNEYATYLAFAAAIALVAIHARATRPLIRKLAIAIAALTTASWPLTYSRSGLVAVVGTLGLIALFNRTRKITSQVAVLLALGVVAWLILPASARATATSAVRSMTPGRMSAALDFSESDVGRVDTFQQTIGERWILDEAALQAIAAHPMAGLGLTEWQAVSPVKTDVYDVKLNHPIIVGATIHNRWLLIGAESGLPTLLMYLGFVGWVLWRAWSGRQPADPEMRFVLEALVACTAALQVAMLAMPGTLWEYNQMAILVTALHVAQHDRSRPLPRPAA